MRALGGAVVVAVLLGACGGSAPEASNDPQFPSGSLSIVANADIAVGPARLTVAVAEGDGTRLGSPEDVIAVEVAPADQPEMRQRADAAFVWIIDDAFGLYRADFDFDRPGLWSLTVVPAEGPPLDPTLFAVNDDNIAPGVGDAAPLVATPTADLAALSEITTDPDPDPRFYEVSLDVAAVSGSKTVAVFSTPAFCRTATCGPVLDQAKRIAPGYPDVNFVHIEIYTGFNDPDFVPDADHLAAPVTAAGWNLPSEPWVFVVDEAGVITHRFEGVVDPIELRDALS